MFRQVLSQVQKERAWIRWKQTNGGPHFRFSLSPYLHELTPMDRDGFVLLDAYMRDCFNEWCGTSGQLSPHSIALLDDCIQSITRRFRLLDGEGQYYFGQFRRLARRILRGIDVERASRQAEEEMDAEHDWKHALIAVCPQLPE